MKTLLAVGSWLLAVGICHAQSSTPYSVVSNDLNSRVWQRTVYIQTNGQTVAVQHRYTELATGLNYTNASGQLAPSSEQINELINALGYTQELDNHPGTYDAFRNNCVSQTIVVGYIVGVTLPKDIYPQDFGMDLNPMPDDE